MTDDNKKALVPSIEGFKMPTFDQIPNVGLYLEQTTTFLNEYLEPLDGTQLTSSMISNYVKKHLIESPIKKQYSREQLAYLFFIAISKTVLPLADLKVLVEIQDVYYQKSIRIFHGRARQCAEICLWNAGNAQENRPGQD